MYFRKFFLVAVGWGFGEGDGEYENINYDVGDEYGEERGRWDIKEIKFLGFGDLWDVEGEEAGSEFFFRDFGFGCWMGDVLGMFLEVRGRNLIVI